MKQVKEYGYDELDRLCDQAAALHSVGNYPESLAVYESVLAEFAENLRALHGIGVVLHKLGRSEEGIAFIRKSLDLKPDFAGAYNNLGNIYADVKNYEAAVDCYQEFITLEPGNDTAYRNLALALLRSGRLDEALNVCNKALEIDPHQPENFMMMGNIHAERGDAEQALCCYKSVFEFAPSSTNAHTNVLFTMNFLAKFTQASIYRESRRWGKLHTADLYIRRPHLNTPVPLRRLRIGYVSGDFKLHPVSYHLKPVVEQHDRENFEIYMYSNFHRFDEMTRKLMELSDHWRNIESLPDERVDEMIRLDGIDILIDLSGHTSLNRLLVFARKPAPVQISWIGYFNTTGMTSIDYLISDAVTVPAGKDLWFSEKVVRLPDGRFCYEPPGYAPEVAPLPALRNGFITFGSFNKLTKITQETVSIWSAVLRDVPKSRLVLKTAALGTESVKNHLLEQFEQNGVDADRIEVRKESKHPQMLAEYGDIDISLDTFPFNGGATTCEALWMGVPVVTMIGRTPISRQSASLLASCGLSELLVANSQSDFIQIARNLAVDINALAQLRASLRGRLSSSPICDGALFTRNLERAYRAMWQEWCDKQKKTVSLKPHHAISAEEYYNAGINCMDEKDNLSAITLFKMAIRKTPDFAEAYNNLGLSLAALGKDFFSQGVKKLKRAIRINPDFGEAHNNLGKLLTELGHYHQAVRICRRATELMPDNPDAYLNLGNACRERGLFLDALASYEIAADMLPASADPLCLIAGLKLSYGDAAGAIESLKRARELRPGDSGIQSNILFAMNYLATCSQQDIFEESCRWDAWYGGQPSGLDFYDRIQETGRLRIGYVSADFHHHPVGIFFQAVARNHNLQNFEVFCYCNMRKTDEVNREIVKHVEHWRDIEGMADSDVLALIQHDGIDLLADLSGHTGGNRLPLFSRRAAPVQISWLGYFNTTGLANMDYVISDNDTVPPGCEQWYREAVIRMPDSRFCYTPPLICPDVEMLPALKNGYITFGCFNNIAKLTPEVIEVWSAILIKMPDSKLVLKWKTLSDGTIRDYYRMLFSMYGVPKRQIEFRGQSPLFMMRDEYNDIDIALDPFPYTGGLTSCEALWMGVPVITLAGDRPVSRQTKGFLKVIGLDELVSETSSGYIECAVQLSGNLERLALIRQGLRQRMASSPLCDGARFTRKLEEIYRNIWQSWRDSVGEDAS